MISGSYFSIGIDIWLLLWDGVETYLDISMTVKLFVKVPFSLLYSLYINDLLVELQHLNGGLFRVVAYADNITLFVTVAHGVFSSCWIIVIYGITHLTRQSLLCSILVFGEFAISRCKARLARSWFIGGYVIAVCPTFEDHFHAVSGSSLGFTLHSISSARSAFYAIQSVSPRFGSLHPLSSVHYLRLSPYVFINSVLSW